MASVKIKNLSRLQAKLDRLEPLTRNAISIGVGLAALAIEGDAKRLAPVDTGALRRSIHTKRIPIPYGARAQIGTNIEYGMYQEFGTSRQQAQPFLKPAIQKNKTKAKQIIITEIVKAHKGI